MTTPFEIPLVPSTPQQLTISLSGTEYTMIFHWCNPAQCWIVDIYDSTGTNLIIGGLSLITGADLLAQYGYKNFGGQLVCQTDHSPDTVPAFNTLGDTSHLYFAGP